VRNCRLHRCREDDGCPAGLAGRLEYRGYDSAGIALVCEDGLEVIKSAERIVKLREQVPSTLYASVGIGHTRWATHGKPSKLNAHPHQDCTGRIAVVHNGIIENYQELKHELEGHGHRFSSETDTEVICHLVEENYVATFACSTRSGASRVPSLSRSSTRPTRTRSTPPARTARWSSGWATGSTSSPRT
jgi:glutamine phosphoribosylpyrophosphate amidotransferase